MSADALVTTLKSIKLQGMAGAVAEIAEQGAPAFRQSGELLEQLIKAEIAEREVRSINYQLQVARFPVTGISPASTSPRARSRRAR